MIGHSAEDLELGLLRQILAVSHDGRDVAAAVAVVRRRPHRHDILGCKVVFEALVDELVGAGYELQVVYVVELGVKD